MKILSSEVCTCEDLIDSVVLMIMMMMLAFILWVFEYSSLDCLLEYFVEIRRVLSDAIGLLHGDFFHSSVGRAETAVNGILEAFKYT